METHCVCACTCACACACACAFARACACVRVHAHRLFPCLCLCRYASESFLNWDKREGVSQLELATRRDQALWQAEMYGYAFGAARANVSHIVRGDTMLYPGYEPRAGLLPTILHYGSDYTIVNEEGGSLITPKHGRSTYFNKMGHKELDLYACRATAKGAPGLLTSQPATLSIQPAIPCTQPATPCIHPACTPMHSKARFSSSTRHRPS